MIEKIFSNPEMEIELKSFIDKHHSIWFRGKDVAEILGYRDTNQAIRKHVDNEDQKSCPVETTGQVRWNIFINESGFYSLVLSSKLETAKKFKRWVTSVVLPNIRKYGQYKLFDPRIKQRVLINGKKYYKHPVFSNYAANKNGEVIHVKTGRIRKMSLSNSGYLFFSIYNKKLEKPKIYTQHRFVFEVFRGSIPRCFEIHHKNSIKSENRIQNLQLLTHKQNVRKRFSKK